MITAFDAANLALSLIAEEAAEHHGGGEGHGFNTFELVSSFVNFAIFLFLIISLAKPKLALVLTARREGMAAQLREAQVKQQEADKRLAEYAQKLENLEGEVAQIVRSFEAQGEADRERMRVDTDKAIERLVREADFTIRQESLKAQRAVREAAVINTLKLAESLIQERITDSDRRRLADEYVAQLERSGQLPS